MLRQFPAQQVEKLQLKNRVTGRSGGNEMKWVCKDSDQLCSYWAQNGACPSWPSMRERCPASCHFC